MMMMKMILSDEYVLRAIELRIKTTRIVGTLCTVDDPKMIHKAMIYFDVWDHNGKISNPFSEFQPNWFKSMTPDVFRIFIEYMHHYGPAISDKEITLIIKWASKFNYVVTRHKDKVTFRINPRRNPPC